MTANIRANGIDIDDYYADHVTSNAPRITGYQVIGIDIQNRYDVLSAPDNINAGARVPASGYITSVVGWPASTDLSDIYCGNASQYASTTPAGGTASRTAWTSPRVLTHTITIAFANAAALTNYFFYGGRILLSASQGTGTTADNVLRTALSSIGTMVIYDLGHYRTGAGGVVNNASIGGSNIGTTETTLFTLTDGSPYTTSNYIVSLDANAAAGSATTLILKSVLNIVTRGSTVDTYTGTYTSVTQQRNLPGTTTAPTITSSLTVV